MLECCQQVAYNLFILALCHKRFIKNKTTSRIIKQESNIGVYDLYYAICFNPFACHVKNLELRAVKFVKNNNLFAIMM